MAETVEKRTQLANDIIKGVIIPQFVVLPIAVLLVWFGLSRGVAPLNALQQRLRARRPDDLSPIDERAAPSEIAPLVAAFGADCLTPDGAMDRTRMRALVFGNDAARQTLEGITHPLIGATCVAQAERIEAAAVHPYILFVIPLLVEGGRWRQTLDRILVVDCPVETQIARVMQRNGFTRAQVEAIIARQATREARLAVADDVIDNGGAPETLPPQVARLHALYAAHTG